MIPTRIYTTVLADCIGISETKMQQVFQAAEEKQPQKNLKLIVAPIRSSEKLQKFLKKANIFPDLSLEKFYKVNIHEEPRVLVVDDGFVRKGQSPSSILESLSGKLRGLTVSEGIWFAMAYPDILDDHAIDLLGSKYSIECIPTIYKWKNKVHLSAVCPDVKDKMCGAPVVYEEFLVLV